MTIQQMAETVAMGTCSLELSIWNIQNVPKKGHFGFCSRTAIKDMALESTVRLTVVFLHMHFYFSLYIRLRAKYIEYMTPKLNDFDSTQDYIDFWLSKHFTIIDIFVCMHVYIYMQFGFQTMQLLQYGIYVLHVSSTALVRLHTTRAEWL